MKHLRWMVASSRVVTWILAILASLVVIAAVSGVLVIRSQWFRERIRRQIIETVNKTTGGRLELGQFSFDWETLTAELSSVVLHGDETEGTPMVAADSVTIGLRILSVAERKVDLGLVRIVRPRVRIVFYPNGDTNIPNPHRPSTWAEDVLDAAVRDYEVVDGDVEYDETRVPLNLRGRSLRIRMTYDPDHKLYRAEVSTDRLQMKPPGYPAFPAALSASVVLERTRLTLSRLRVSTRDSHVDLAGTMDDIRFPHGTLTVRASVGLRDAVNLFAVPIQPVGTAIFEGKATVRLAPKFDIGIAGKLAARGAGYSRGTVKLEDAALAGDLNLTLDRLSLHNIQAQALGARWTGNADLARWQDLRVEGSVDGMGLHDAAVTLGQPALPYTASMTGGFTVAAKLGAPTMVAAVNLAIAPAAGGRPLEGQLDLTYDQAAGSIALRPSWASTAASRLDLSGTFGQTLQGKLHSTDLDDLLPALALMGSDAPKSLPVKLMNGTADLEGAVAGPLNNPRFTGRVTVASASLEGHPFDRFSADLRAGKDQIQATSLALARGNTTVAGSASIMQREDSFDDGALAAQLDLRSVALPELMREAGAATAVPDLAGVASATVRLTGSVRKPEADVTADIQRPAAFGEQADRLRATVHYSPDRVEVRAADATSASSSIKFSGTYAHDATGWNNGQLNFAVSTQSLPTARIHHMDEVKPPLEAVLSGDLHGAGRIANRAFDLTALDGTFSAQRLAVDKQLIGELSATFQTRNADLGVRFTGKLRESTLDGNGSWRLQGDQAGGGTLTFSRLNVATLNSLAMLGGTPEQQASTPPFDGFIEGGVTFSVPLRKPDQYRADVTLNTVQFNPQPSKSLGVGVQAQDILLRNSRPVILAVTPDGLRINTAQFAARDTSLEVSGSVPFRANSADLAIKGNINLGILQLFNSDLLAKGNATVDASVRGNVQNPSVNGRMQLTNASLYLSDLPNGIDNANGVILFDRNRATIDRLIAETGGGRISFGGMVEFGSTLLYRLQADAQQVRVRWPDDVSTSFNSHLELNGTPGASTLSGTLTLNRTVLNPRTDLGRLMADAAKPAPAPANPNEYLRGMQFDVHVESGPDFKLDTALTREVQTQVDLRLRGTPLRPVVLGSISVNEGEVQIFGNKYSIDRGDVRFQNPVKLDPILDLSLETKARGIAVNVSISGTLQKLKVNYSSDPPLQSSEIIALLAVGRDPLQSAGITNPSAISNTGFVEAGGSLLGEAVSQQLSGTLQRFFGASRVKIDPTLTGVDNSPQARLTLEQQVSKDVTLTYITNLNRTQEQTVRVQWDFDRNWSAIAVRDANGLFGIDVQYRKRFK